MLSSSGGAAIVFCVALLLWLAVARACSRSPLTLRRLSQKSTRSRLGRRAPPPKSHARPSPPKAGNDFDVASSEEDEEEAGSSARSATTSTATMTAVGPRGQGRGPIVGSASEAATTSVSRRLTGDSQKYDSTRNSNIAQLQASAGSQLEFVFPAEPSMTTALGSAHDRHSGALFPAAHGPGPLGVDGREEAAGERPSREESSGFLRESESESESDEPLDSGPLNEANSAPPEDASLARDIAAQLGV